MSQSPQIGSMFRTGNAFDVPIINLHSRNPLKSGQCSGQSFLIDSLSESIKVAIPSNRVNVPDLVLLFDLIREIFRRNPLKSGQCSGHSAAGGFVSDHHGRNPLKSGQCSGLLRGSVLNHSKSFCRNPLKSGQCSGLEMDLELRREIARVAIPSNRVNVPDTTSGCLVQLRQVCRNPLKSGQCSGRRGLR